MEYQMPRSVYAIIGLFVGAIVDLLINLLAAAIGKRAFDGQSSSSAVIWLAAAAVVGLLVGYWLGGPFQVPPVAPAQAGAAVQSDGVMITRLRALFSYAELQGRGVSLSDILLIGSRIKINTKD
jgi:hypothetical protein